MPELTKARCTKCEGTTTHTILKGAPNQIIQCTECHNIQSTTPKKEKKHTLKIVVSHEDNTTPYTITKPAEEEIRTGNEFILETTEDKATIVRVTDLESKERRVKQAKAKDIQTIWARNIEEVTIRVSLNLGPETKAIKYDVPGEKEFTIGTTEDYKNISYIIKKIKLQHGGFVYREGKTVLAKDIKRIFAIPRDANRFKTQQRKPAKSGSLIEGRETSWSLAKKRRD